MRSFDPRSPRPPQLGCDQALPQSFLADHHMVLERQFLGG